jgi:endonuclease YncB( thermonuclease family)
VLSSATLLSDRKTLHEFYPLSVIRYALWLFLALLAGPLTAAELSGKVVGVSDGDTLTLLVADGSSFKQVKVRLGEIDTPESRQPYGERAKQALSDRVFGKPARVVVETTDKYGRTVGRVYVGGVDVNAELVKQGAAWVYRINRCWVWKLKPKPPSVGCGHCRKPSGCRRGTGDMAEKPKHRRYRVHRLPVRPLPLRPPAATLPVAVNGTARR